MPLVHNRAPAIVGTSSGGVDPERMRLPDPAADLFARQHSVASRQQLLTVASEAEVDAWRRQGLVRQVYRGVLAVRGASETPHSRLNAAVLRGGRDARADGRASCWLLGLEGFDPSVGVVVPPGRKVTGAPFSIKSTVLEELDTATVEEIPCLSATRALIEVAPKITEKALRVAIDSGRRQGLLTIERLEERAVALQSLHGARIVLRVIGSKALDKESEGERALAPALHGIAGIEWGVQGLVPGRRLDALLRDALLVLEYDGRDHHVLPTDRDADGLRDLEIRSVKVDGVPLEVIHITSGMLREAPGSVRAFVLRRREERLAEIAALRAHGPT